MFKTCLLTPLLFAQMWVGMPEVRPLVLPQADSSMSTMCGVALSETSVPCKARIERAPSEVSALGAWLCIMWILCAMGSEKTLALHCIHGRKIKDIGAKRLRQALERKWRQVWVALTQGKSRLAGIKAIEYHRHCVCFPPGAWMKPPGTVDLLSRI